MAQKAPETPTTQDLHAEYLLDSTAELNISVARSRVSSILIGEEPGLVAIIGPCAMTRDRETINREGDVLSQLTNATPGLTALHRMPPWKPRTNPEDWHGEETTDPSGAYRTLSSRALLGAGVSIEIGMSDHVERYGRLVTLGWIGGRNIGNTALMAQLAVSHPDMPMAIKNGLDGELEPALTRVAHINQLRGSDQAPAVLLYRGGDAARDPASWERLYREALTRTGGRMIIDVAHGSEMAHDPAGTFKKSSEGQMAALEHVLTIAERHGELPAGIMAEASDAASPTDPHMPFKAAVSAIERLHSLTKQDVDDMAAV